MRNDMDENVTVLKGVDYSTCPLSDETWRVSASRCASISGTAAAPW